MVSSGLPAVVADVMREIGPGIAENGRSECLATRGAIGASTPTQFTKGDLDNILNLAAFSAMQREFCVLMFSRLFARIDELEEALTRPEGGA